MKASLLEESIMHPVIDDISRRIVEEKLADTRYSRPIHERLFDLNKELLDKKELQRQQEDSKFKQQSSVILESGKKRENLDQILYDDAERRRKDLEIMKEKIDRVRDTPQGKPYHNEKSEKYVQ